MAARRLACSQETCAGAAGTAAVFLYHGLYGNTRLTVLPFAIEQGFCARGAQPPCQGQARRPVVSQRIGKYWVAADSFDLHLNMIVAGGPCILSLKDFWRTGTDGRGESLAAILTFDDGLSSDYEIAFPSLLKIGACATFFLNTANIGKPGYLDWSRIDEMARAGMSFGSHSHQHLYLTRLSQPILVRQLVQSKQAIEDRLGCPVDFLSAPYGELNQRVLDTARGAGYLAICTSRGRPASAQAALIDRLGVDARTTMDEFRGLLAGEPRCYAARAARETVMRAAKRVLLPFCWRRIQAREQGESVGQAVPPISLNIFVLIDALGWQVLRDRDFLQDLLPFRVPLRTVLGFSSGAIPSILTGLPPAETGHWNLLYYDPAGSPFKWLRFFAPLPRKLLDNRLSRKLLKELGRRLLGMGPLFECCVSPRLLPFFNWVEKRNIYGRRGISGAPSVFDHLDRSGIRYRAYSYHTRTDSEILRQAQADLATGAADFYFLYLSELDALLHHACRQPEVLQRRLDWYAAGLRGLYETAAASGRDLRFTVFSDHGMTPVSGHYDVAAEVERLGFSMPGDFLAVYDSTMARFWFFSEPARREIVDRLGQLSCGRLLDDLGLHDLGILFPDRRYGEVIFLMHPGLLIAQSDFNGPSWTPAGMHGYHPDDSHSDAVFLSNRRPPVEVRAISDVYHCMSDAAGLRDTAAASSTADWNRGAHV